MNILFIINDMNDEDGISVKVGILFEFLERASMPLHHVRIHDGQRLQTTQVDDAVTRTIGQTTLQQVVDNLFSYLLQNNDRSNQRPGRNPQVRNHLSYLMQNETNCAQS